MEKKNWGTFTKIWFGLSIAVSVLALFGVGAMLVRLQSLGGNPNVNAALYQRAVTLLWAAAAIVVLGLAATIWLIKSKSSKALYTVTGISILNVIISLVNNQMPQAVGGVIGAVIIWLLCRKVVFDIE